MRQLLTLSKSGKLALRSKDGKETIIEQRPSNVLLLLDTSGSMAGNKLEQAKSGAIDFARSASTKRYATALAVFADRAAMVCDPVTDPAILGRKMEKLDVGIVGGATNLAAGLILAGKVPQLAAVVIVTDGATDNNAAALEASVPLKRRGVEIICIGTDDADRKFLALLATRADLANHVSVQHLRSAITEASRMLPRG